MNYRDRSTRAALKENLMKLSKKQLKLFYGILVHGWASRKAFISTQSFFNLWCELNSLCAEVDEGFPDPYDDRELLRSYCHAHPYYFIDRLSPEIIIDLFCEYMDDRLDVLATIAQKLDTEGLRAAYEYINEAMGLGENIEELVQETEKNIKGFS